MRYKFQTLFKLNACLNAALPIQTSPHLSSQIKRIQYLYFVHRAHHCTIHLTAPPPRHTRGLSTCLDKDLVIVFNVAPFILEVFTTELAIHLRKHCPSMLLVHQVKF